MLSMMAQEHGDSLANHQGNNGDDSLSRGIMTSSLQRDILRSPSRLQA